MSETPKEFIEWEILRMKVQLEALQIVLDEMRARVVKIQEKLGAK